MKFFFIHNLEFEIYLGQMYPVKRETGTRQGATILLLTWIYLCRSGGKVKYDAFLSSNIRLWRLTPSSEKFYGRYGMLSNPLSPMVNNIL